MKRRNVMALLLTIVLVSISGCGAKDNTIETQVNEPEVVTEEASESEVEEQVVTDSAEPETEIQVATVATDEIDFDKFNEDEAKDHQFGDMSYVAQYRDIRTTTGKNSTSTSDVWEYLTEDGVIDTAHSDDLWEYGARSYTGRWAYPTLLESEVTKDLYLYDWTDSYCTYIADEGENNNAILICTGYDVFNLYTSGDDEAEYTFEVFSTYNVGGEDIEVYSVSGDEQSVTYLYKLGGFTVVIEFSGEENSFDEELLLEVMNDIVL